MRGSFDEPRIINNERPKTACQRLTLLLYYLPVSGSIKPTRANLVGLMINLK